MFSWEPASTRIEAGPSGESSWLGSTRRDWLGSGSELDKKRVILDQNHARTRLCSISSDVLTVERPLTTTGPKEIEPKMVRARLILGHLGGRQGTFRRPRTPNPGMWQTAISHLHANGSSIRIQPMSVWKSAGFLPMFGSTGENGLKRPGRTHHHVARVEQVHVTSGLHHAGLPEAPASRVLRDRRTAPHRSG